MLPPDHKMKNKISLIVAVSDNQGIGLDNKLPWGHIPEDMKWFKHHTEGHVVVMGSKTYDSLPEAFRPLPKRTNVVLTRGTERDADLNLQGDAQKVIEEVQATYPDQEIFIIGGEEVYKQFIHLVDRVLVTRVRQVVVADAFLDIDAMMNDKFTKIDEQEGEDIAFQIWERNE
jgi:dihydrofolate reductase